MEINDYYKVFGLKYKFTAFELLNRYFVRAKLALATNNKAEFIKVRMGFEVLRDNNATEDYNRIYRKYILNETLNFPIVREHQMINTFQAREQLGAQIAEQVILRQETFLLHRLKFFIQFILRDIIRAYPYGCSGVLFMSVGLGLMIQIQNPINVIGGIFLILVGLYFFRQNMKGIIMIN